MRRRCKHCQNWMDESEAPANIDRKGRKYPRWECRPCLALLARERKARKRERRMTLSPTPHQPQVQAERRGM